MKTKFPHVLAAAENREKHKSGDLWALGDALIQDIGTPADRGGGGDGSYAKMKAAARDLKLAGFADKEYALQSLVNYRTVAFAFPRNRRHPEVAFYNHKRAGSPDFLDWIVEESGTDVTAKEIDRMRKRWQILEREQRKKKLEQAKEEAKRAPTPKAREDAEERVRHLVDSPSRPPRELPAPDRESHVELKNMAAFLDLESDAEAVTKDLNDAVKALRKHLSTIDDKRDDISVEFIDSMVETYRALATAGEEITRVSTQIADRLGKTRLKRFESIRGGKAS